jgi:hypothetical protein
MWTQILLPIFIAALIFTAVIIITSLATFRDQGDVSRWAAISTIWLILPVLVAGLIFLIFLVGMIYLLVRVMKLIPPYSLQVQMFVYRIESGVKRFAELFRKPMLALQEIARLVRNYVDHLRKTNSSKF